MRIFQGVTLAMLGIFFALLFGAVALLALGFQLGGVKNEQWATLCYVLAALLLIASLLALFWHRLPELRRYLWLVGVPLLCGLLLGGMEWLISVSLYNALGIGAATYALAQIAFGFWVPRLSQRRHENTKLKQELEQAREELEQAKSNGSGFGTHTIVQEDPADAIQSRNTEIERLVAENEQLRNQPDGDGLRRDWLKRECRDMAAYLRWFLKDHEQETEDQIVDLYRERYQDKVAVLIQQLEQQDLYPPEGHKSFRIAADKFPRSPLAIRNLAGTLGSIGQEI